MQYFLEGIMNATADPTPTQELTTTSSAILIILSAITQLALALLAILIIALCIHELDHWNGTHPQHRAWRFFFPTLFLLSVVSFLGVVFADFGLKKVAAVVLMGIWLGLFVRRWLL
jgi:hypothetical protein